MPQILIQFWTKSISRQLMLGIALVHAVLMSIFVYDLVGRERTFMIEQSRSQAVGLVETLAANGSSWVLANDFIGIEEVISSQSGFPSLQYAMFTDMSGKVLGFTDRQAVGQYVRDEISLIMLVGDDITVLIDDDNIIDVAAPILANDIQVGWARVGVSRKGIVDNLHVVSRDGLLYTVIAILIGLAFAWLMSKGLTSAIHKLLLASQQTQQGSRDVDFTLARQDELGQLSRGFMDTVATLASSEQAFREEHERILVTLNSIGDAVIVTDTDGNITSLNPVAVSLTGWAEKDAKGLELSEVFRIVNVSTGKTVDNPVTKVLETGEIVELAHHTALISRGGEEYQIMDSAAPIRNGDNNIIGVILVFHDVTEQYKDRQLMEESEARFRTLYNENPTMFFTMDKDCTVLSVNDYGAEQLGYPVEDIVGNSVIPLFHEDDKEQAQKFMQECFNKPSQVHRCDLRKHTKDGLLIRVRETARVIYDQDRNPAVLVVCEDITESYILSQQLSYQATHDALTGLVNRAEFEERAKRLITTVKQDKTVHALCFMDLDQFKIVNDTCGHTAGDELLRQITELLQGHVRQRDTLARLGGDEFGVLMEHCSIEQTQRVAGTLQKAIQEYQFSWEEHSFRVGVSMGLVALNEDTPNLAEVLKHADMACYAAKGAGRNRIHVYHDDDESLQEHQGEMQWVARIYQALEEDKFCIFAQPIVSLSQENVIHYELLIRMIGDAGEMIPPGAFLPAAERYNLITQIDQWVVNRAITTLSSQPGFMQKMTFCSINISGPSLADPAFKEYVIDVLNNNEIDASKICFEITETAAIANLSLATAFISDLKQLGCCFALDDFGSGLSSFGYLKNLPVDYLKIDGMFVRDIANDPIDYAMVKSINEIGQVMGMKTIAEFVENDEIKALLMEIGVDYAQGYGIGKPKACKEVLSS